MKSYDVDFEYTEKAYGTIGIDTDNELSESDREKIAREEIKNIYGDVQDVKITEFREVNF